MKIEPVYLLAPEPDRRVILSRRQLMGMGIGLLAVGATAGFAISRFAAGETQRAESRTSVPPDLLTWAIAQSQAPIAELMRNLPGFVSVVLLHPKESRLWVGLERACTFVITAEDPRRWHTDAITLRNCVRQVGAAQLTPLLEQLESVIRAGESKR